jgi:hypothetical protein
MPKQLTPLAMQIKLLEVMLRADAAERKATEAPLRAARSVLRERLRKLRCNLTKAQARREQMLAAGWKAFKLTLLTEQEASFMYGSKWTNNAASIARFKAEVDSTELDLALFQEIHPELTECP